jgi:uncharacterized lipoprotein YddW (UPF0748 family)
MNSSTFLSFVIRATAVLTLAWWTPALLAQAPFTPKREVRAVWVTTAAGLDWPKSLDRREQQLALQSIVQRLKRAHFNTIYFQVRARGDAYYHSRYEPWAENLTGTLGKDPGWDPLQLLLMEAHAAGIEVHAWFNVYKIRGPQPVKSSAPPHPSLAFPAWVREVDGEAWLDPGTPAVRMYLENVALDLIRTYDLDGINFDFLRYPGREFQDDESYARFGRGMAKDDWRRLNITRFVKEFYEKAVAVKPMLKIGCAPLGVFDGESGIGSAGSFHDYYQDAPGWLREGIMDYVSPQIYWNLGSSPGDPDFAVLARRWTAFAGGKQIYTGIAAYKPEVLKELVQQIDSARSAGTSGQAFFRYENIQSFERFTQRYDSHALIPPMAWKDSIPLEAPTGLTAAEVATNVFRLAWTPPRRARDGDTARYYAVYRSVSSAIPFSSPSSIVAVSADPLPSWLDTVSSPSGLSYTYAVTAFEKGNNESEPSNTSTVTSQALLALRQKIAVITSLSASVSSLDGRPALVAYRLSQRVPVSLDIIGGEGQDSLVATVVQKMQERGTYVVALTDLTFTPGTYVLRLRAGTTILEQPVFVRK